MHGLRTALLLTAATLAGCTYDFNNPAEELLTGEASGTVLTDPLGTGTPVATAGVVVGLKGSALDQSSRPNGRFIVYDLPVGQHRLLFRDGASATLERDVELGYGANGQPDGVDLGEVVVTGAAVIEGRFSLPLGFAVASGVVVEERSGLTAMLAVLPDGTSSFAFPAISVGSHSFKVTAKDTSGGGTWVGGKVTLDVPAGSSGTTISLANIAGRAASASGHLRLTVQLLGLSLSPTAVSVWIDPDPTLLSPITPASNGQVDVLVPEGLYQVTVTAAATAPPLARLEPGQRFSAASLPAPVPTVLPGPAWAVVLSNSPGEAGSLYVASDPSISASLQGCREAADCGGTSCSANRCTSYTPPQPPVSGTTAWCTPCTYAGAGATPGYGGSCDAGPNVPGLCFCPASKGVDCALAVSAPVASYCAPQACGFGCTPDGSSTVTYTPVTGVCP